jgi:hypothetical protein
MEGAKPMSTLEMHIASALSGEITSAAVAALIAEIEAAISQADVTAERERTKALDPALSPDARAARETLAAAEFARDRLRTVLPRLEARHQEIAAAEYETQWRADYEELGGKCDALAAELRELYPAFATKIADLFGRIATNDAEISRLHQARPAGTALHLPGAELMARNLAGFTRGEPSIAKELRLPDWLNATKMAWPPPTVPLAALIAPPASGDPRRYSGDWWRVKEEEARAVRERQEREAAEQEAKARENWHGPRWWEAERA